jgi:hypothetical protein
MIIESYAARDLAPRDALTPDLQDFTVPGNEQLVKGGAPTQVAILIEMEVQTVAA